MPTLYYLQYQTRTLKSCSECKTRLSASWPTQHVLQKTSIPSCIKHLHWLPIGHRIDYVSKLRTTGHPGYSSHAVRDYIPTRELRSSDLKHIHGKLSWMRPLRRTAGSAMQRHLRHHVMHLRDAKSANNLCGCDTGALCLSAEKSYDLSEPCTGLNVLARSGLARPVVFSARPGPARPGPARPVAVWKCERAGLGRAGLVAHWLIYRPTYKYMYINNVGEQNVSWLSIIVT